MLHNSSSWERGVKIYERDNSADSQVSEGGGAGCALGTIAEINLQPVLKTVVMDMLSLGSPWWSMVEQISTMQLMEDPTQE